MNWGNALCDKDGDVNVAEIIAAIGGAGGILVPIHAYFAHGTAFDLQAYGVGLAAIVGALGAAQRLRGDAGK